MSRTIRRTKTNKRNPRFLIDYVTYLPQEWDGRDIGNRGIRWVKDFPRFTLEGKAYDKAYWKFHSDQGFAEFFYEDNFEFPMHEVEGDRRARYKREIVKWLKDEEYEIQFQRCKQVWDYY